MMTPDPLALLEAETARADADYYIRQAGHAAKRGEIAWTLYFLDAADWHGEPSPEAAAERVGLLLGAMEQLAERTGDRG